MSDVENFVRFCESNFESAVMDREAAYLDGKIDVAEDAPDEVPEAGDEPGEATEQE